MLQARGALLITDEICTDSGRGELSLLDEGSKLCAVGPILLYFFFFSLQAVSEWEKPLGLESYLAFWAGIHSLT